MIKRYKLERGLVTEFNEDYFEKGGDLAFCLGCLQEFFCGRNPKKITLVLSDRPTKESYLLTIKNGNTSITTSKGRTIQRGLYWWLRGTIKHEFNGKAYLAIESK